MKRIVIGALLISSLSLSGSAAGTASDPFLKQIKELMQAKNYNRAITLINNELRSKPQEYQLWLAMGYCYEGLQQSKDALEAFKRARTLNPKIPGIDNRIASIEKILKISEGKKIDEHLTPEQKQAKELFAKVVKDKLYGRFEEAFNAFPACVDLNPDYLNGNDEGVIAAGLNYFQDKMERGDSSALFMLSVYQYFKGDFFTSEQGLYKFIEQKPPLEQVEKAQKYLKLIAESREKQKLALVKEPPKKDPDKSPIKAIDKTAAKSPGKTPETPDSAKTSPAKQATAPMASGADSNTIVDFESHEKVMEDIKAEADRQATRLVKEFGSAQEARQHEIIYDLGWIGSSGQDTLNLFEQTLESKNPLTFVYTLEAIRKIGPGAAPLGSHIAKSVAEFKDFRLTNALNTLGRIKAADEDSLGLLIDKLKSGTDEQQTVSFSSLVRIGDPAVPALIEMKNKAIEESEKKTAAKAIAQIRNISLDEALNL